MLELKRKDKCFKATYSTKFTKGDFPITIFVSIYYSFIHNLLKLGFLQVVSDHHLKNLEKFSI